MSTSQLLYNSATSITGRFRLIDDDGGDNTGSIDFTALNVKPDSRGKPARKQVILAPLVSTYTPAPAPSSGGNATMVLVLGIVGLVGALGSCCCCLFLVLEVCAPIAWVLGHKELAAIRAGQSPASGESAAKAGMICGIIGTCLLALYFIGIIIYVALVGVGAAMETLKQGGVPLPR